MARSIPKDISGGLRNASAADKKTMTDSDAIDRVLAEGVAVPEEMRGKIPSDFGRDKGIAWYYIGGFGIVHPLVAADGSKNSRIVEWDSAS